MLTSRILGVQQLPQASCLLRPVVTLDTATDPPRCDRFATDTWSRDGQTVLRAVSAAVPSAVSGFAGIGGRSAGGPQKESSIESREQYRLLLGREPL